MPKLLLRTNHASDDEIAEVSELLNQNSIDFYQTDAGTWGISVAGIWSNQNHQYQQAKELIDDYQQQRSLRLKKEYAELKQQGLAPGLLDSFKQQPLRFVVFSLLAGFILWLSLQPFLAL